jgi:hypothetical protein
MNKKWLVFGSVSIALTFSACDLFNDAKDDAQDNLDDQTELKVDIPEGVEIDDTEKEKIAQMSEKCQGEYLDLQGNDGGPSEVFVKDCLGEVEDAWKPEGLSEKCETLYAAAFEPVDSYKDVDCSDKANEKECDAIDENLKNGAEDFYTECESEVPKEEPIFPWDEGDHDEFCDGPDCHEPCEGPDCHEFIDPECKPEKIMSECPSEMKSGENDLGQLECCDEASGHCFVPFDFSECEMHEPMPCENADGTDCFIDEELKRLCSEEPENEKCKEFVEGH